MTSESLSRIPLETIGDLPRSLLYTEKHSEEIARLHEQLTLERTIPFPYTDFAETGEDFLFTHEMSPGITLYVGRVGAFSRHQMARIIHEQTINYVLGGTMGKNFPKDDPTAAQDLLATMAGEFDANRIVVLCEYQGHEGANPISSVQAQFGKLSLPLRQVIQTNISTLPTYQALTFVNGFSDSRIGKFLSDFGDLPEENAVCLSRLFRQHKTITDVLGVNDPVLPWKLMAALSVGITEAALRYPNEISFPRIGIYDTHTRDIQEKLERYFSMKCIGLEGMHEATEEIQQSILHYHYGNDGGFLPHLVTGYVEMPDYVVSALTFLSSHGIDFQSPEITDYLAHIFSKPLEQHGYDGPSVILNRDLDISVVAPELLLLDPKTRTVFQWAEEQNPEIRHPDFYRPVVMNHHTEKGMRMLKEYAALCPDPHQDISLDPFARGMKELTELAKFYQNIPRSEEDIQHLFISKLCEQTTGIPEDDIRSVVAANPLVHDLSAMVSTLHRIAKSDGDIERDSRWLWFPTTKQLVKYTGVEAHRLFLQSRLIGLIPGEIVQAIRQWEIVSAGSSAVAKQLKLLVSLGAEHVRWYDKGYIDPTNISRFPGGMGDVRSVGKTKALQLEDVAYGINPYGEYQGFFGRLVAEDTDKTGPFDIAYAEFAKASFGEEVVDNPWTKTGVRAFLEAHHPEFPLLFLADVGNHPLVSIERAKHHNPFHQLLSPEEFAAMNTEPQDPQEKRKEGLISVYNMLRHDMPPEHTMQFLAFLLNLMPYWSQTPIAAAESAAISNKLIFSLAEGNPVAGRNFHADTAPQSLVPPYTPEQLVTIGMLCDQLFHISHTHYV